jgi:formyltetrahydrofolate deformylase
MQWQLKGDVGRPASRSVRVAVPRLPGRHSARRQSGELRCSIPLVISNHRSAEALANFHGVAFHPVPVMPDIRKDAEGEQRRLLTAAGIDLFVLARYLQILSPEFVAQYPGRIINVHHSFLPAFMGARPYHAAFRRGVKLIGATSHYVNGEAR